MSELKQIKPGAIYLVQPDEDGLTVKRVFLESDRLILMSDNPDRRAHPPRSVPLKGRPPQQIVIGRVPWIGNEQGD